MASLRAGYLVLFLVIPLFSSSQAREFGVGGRGSSWKIPSSPDAYDKWAQKNRFQIGDSLVMEYDPNNDSVLEVSEEDYNNCNRANPIRTFNDGNTKIQLDRSGPFYFISGADGHCEKGQKLAIRVISPRQGSAIHISPAPAHPTVYPPAPAPASNEGHVLKLGILGVMFGSLAAFALV